MIERQAENLLYASRWLLAPIYIGLSLALLMLGIKFFQEVIHTLPIILSTKEPRLVYLDPKMGFQAKWSLKEYVTKIEHLEAHPESDATRFIIFYDRFLDKYKNYFSNQEVYHFDGLMMVKEIKEGKSRIIN